MKAAGVGHLTGRPRFAVIGFLAFATVALCSGRGDAVTDDDIVNQFVPQRVVDEANSISQAGGPALAITSAFTRADLDGIGVANYIVVVYTNGVGARLRIVRDGPGGPSLVADPDLRRLMGLFPRVDLIDFDNDGRPEIVVSMASARGPSATWIFKWNGNGVVVFGPSSVDGQGNVYTLLTDSQFVELSGSGVLDIVQPPVFVGGDSVAGLYRVYTLSVEGFSLSGTFVFAGVFERGAGKPVVERRNFVVPIPQQPVEFTILNGDIQGGVRVKSAVISVNGVLIASPNNFNQQRRVTGTFTAAADNILEVELHGAPGSHVSILIKAATVACVRVPRQEREDDEGQGRLVFRVTASDLLSQVTLGHFALTNGEVVQIQRTKRPGVQLVGKTDDDDRDDPRIRRFRVGPGANVIKATDAAGNVGTAECPLPLRREDDEKEDKREK